jgi:DNA-binding MarR family transcriptional regulator
MVTMSTKVNNTQAIKKFLSNCALMRTQNEDIPVLATAIFCLIAESNLRGKPLCMADIGEAMGVSTSTVSRNVSLLGKNLVRPGRAGRWGLDLIRPEEDPADRRQVLLFLTTKGKTIALQINQSEGS